LEEAFSKIIGRRERDRWRNRRKEKNGGVSRGEAGRGRNRISIERDKKATGIDGIVEEAWFYSDGQIREKFKELLKRIWKGTVFRKNGGKE